MKVIFEPNIKNKRCKHKWTKLTTRASSLFVNLEFDYLICEKCSSTNGDVITM